MDRTRFDRLATTLATGASRRRLIAGLGVIATGGLLTQTAAAAPSPKAACMKQCNATAKARRRASCAGLRNKAKNACLKEVKAERATCRQTCHAPVEEPVEEAA